MVYIQINGICTEAETVAEIHMAVKIEQRQHQLHRVRRENYPLEELIWQIFEETQEGE